MAASYRCRCVTCVSDPSYLYAWVPLIAESTCCTELADVGARSAAAVAGNRGTVPTQEASKFCMSWRTDLLGGSGWHEDAQMLRISAGLVICLAAAVAVGCGTVPAPHSGSGAHTAVPVKTANRGTQPGASAAGPATAGSSSGCQNPVSAGTGEPTATTLVITLAGNARTYCARVGDRLRVDLRGTDSDPWLRPLASGDALVPIPGAVTGGAVTSASFAAVQQGRVIMTSVRPPCRVAVPSAKNELEPAFPLPKIYPFKSCPPGHRFSALVIVQR